MEEPVSMQDLKPQLLSSSCLSLCLPSVRWGHDGWPQGLLGIEGLKAQQGRWAGSGAGCVGECPFWPSDSLNVCWGSGVGGASCRYPWWQPRIDSRPGEEGSVFQVLGRPTWAGLPGGRGACARRSLAGPGVRWGASPETGGGRAWARSRAGKGQGGQGWAGLGPRRGLSGAQVGGLGRVGQRVELGLPPVCPVCPARPLPQPGILSPLPRPCSRRGSLAPA